jgi:hypothetical protein
VPEIADRDTDNKEQNIFCQSGLFVPEIADRDTDNKEQNIFCQSG